MRKYKFEIETITADRSNKFKTYVAFCGLPQKYIFTTMRTVKPDSYYTRQLLSENFRDSDYLEENEINEENLKKFHLDSIKYFMSTN